MRTEQELSREIAIYEVMLDNDGLPGSNYPDARRKLRDVLLRPADIHLVERMAKSMQYTTLIMEDGRLRLNMEVARERLKKLVQRLGHPSYKDVDDELKARIIGLNDRLEAQLQPV